MLEKKAEVVNCHEETKAGLARRLGISRSSLYYRAKRPEKDEQLRRDIEALLLKEPAYGHRRIADALKVNKKRVRRVMKMFNIKPPRRQRKIPAKPDDSGREAAKINDITSILCPAVPDFLWVSDFTYLWFHGRFVFLATILDGFTREVRGAKMMLNHSSELVLEAFRDAVRNAGRAPMYAHSDQGSEYNSASYLNELKLLGVAPSMAPKSSPWRNGHQESFFGRFKVEFGDPERFETLPELIEAIYQHIAHYNLVRIHTAFRCSPVDFKMRWLAKRQCFRAPSPHGGKEDFRGLPLNLT